MKVLFEPGVGKKVLCDIDAHNKVVVCGHHTKASCTVLLTVTRTGHLLAPLVVFAGKTQQQVKRTSNSLYPAMIKFQPNAYMNGKLWCDYLNFVSPALPRPTLAVFDHFSGHITEDALTLMNTCLKQFHYALVPAHGTAFVQPLDKLVNRSWKCAFRRLMEAEMAIRGNVPTGAVEWRELVLRVVERATDEIRAQHTDQLRLHLWTLVLTLHWAVRTRPLQWTM